MAPGWIEVVSALFLRNPKMAWRRRVITVALFSSLVLPVLLLAALTRIPPGFLFGSILLFSFFLASVVIFALRVLQRGEEKYRVLVSSNPYIFWTSDRQGKPTFISSSLQDICGVSPDQIYGTGPRFWLERIHPEDVDSIEKAYASLQETGKSIELEYRFEKSEGNWIWLQEKATLAPVALEDVYVERVLSDVTRRKEAELSAARLAAIVASSDDAIIGVTLGAVVESWNRGAERVFGYSAQETHGRSLWMLFPYERREEIMQIFDNVAKGSRVCQYDTRWVRKDGVLIDVSLMISPIHDTAGKIAGISTIARDISDQKKTEKQRLLLTQEQERRDNAEQAQQRANFLAQASLLLSSSLDYEETLRRLARLLTVKLADWCVLYLTEGRKTIARTIVAHPDPAAEQMAGQFFQRVLGSGLKGHPVLRVLSTGKPEIIAENDGLASGNSDYRQLIQTLGSQSVMIVPLIVRGQTLGAIEFVATKPAHAYDADDLAMAEEISHYASVAMENARLYTETLKAKETAHALAAIVESSDDAIIGKTLDGVVTSWNRGAEKLYGYKAAEIIGRSISLLVPSDRPEEMAAILMKLKAGHIIEHFETVRLRKDGVPLNVSLTISLMKNAAGAPMAAATIARDVTERKRYEEGLAKARDAAIASDQLKSEFVANVSHEVRTPMNGIIGMTSLLLDTKLAPKQRDFVETIRGSCDSLLTIVNDILDFSKIEAGKMSLEIQDFDLSQLLESTGEFLAPRAHFKGLELISIVAHDLPVALRGDPARVRQVLTNFIGNAVKFTEKGNVAVRATKDSETDTHVTVQLSVADTGIGIALERQNQLFQPFSQADASATRKYGGTGLGLAISKRFVELMGGEIGVTSAAGQGSTFWCLITFEKQKNPVDASPEMNGECSPLRILVVDENPVHREAVIHQLNRWKTCAVECAADGVDALEILKQEAVRGNPYQVVIINQPAQGEPVLALARQIKNHADLSGVRVVVLVMVNQPLDSNVMQDAGIAASLSKPVKPAALFECLLPAMKKEPAATQPNRPAEEKARRRRFHILVVEDNGVNQKVMLQQLENLGYSSDAVGNGLEAIQALEHVPYDLVLMDCQMPEMDGYAATAMIRKREGQKTHMPIIAMTAHVMTGDREKCLAAGMDDYIPKPIKTENLRATLARWEGSSPGEKKSAPAGAVSNSSQNPLNDPRFVRQVSRLFVQETPKYLQAMRHALKKKDTQALYVAAHTLAGSCCIVGTQEIKSLCRELEEKARGRKLNGVDKILTELDQEFEVAQKMFKVGKRRGRHESSYRR